MVSVRRLIHLLLVTGLFVALVSSFAYAAPSDEPPPAESIGFIVKMKAGTTLPGELSIGRERLRVRPMVGGSRTYLLPDGADPRVTRMTLRADPRVEWVEPNYVREPLGFTSTPNDPDFSDPAAYTISGTTSLQHARSWFLRGHGSMDAAVVWPYLESSATKSYGARADAAHAPVAVIDTGFYMDHPERGATIVAGKDLFESYTKATDTWVTDYDVTPASPTVGGNDPVTASHGTCVAGQIAASTGNGIGTSGVGYDAIVRVYKVMGVITDYDTAMYPNGMVVIPDSALIDAIKQAADDGCKVINMSLGGPGSSQALQDAVNYAHARGAVVVAATGNGGAEGALYPAACTNVVGVGSYTVASNASLPVTYSRSTFTNYGLGLDVLAPGVMVWGLAQPGYDADGPGTVYRPGYYWWQGTSMASPNFAGGVATLWRLAPFLTNDEIAAYAMLAAHDMGAVGYDTATGYGAFNIEAARQDLVADYPELAAPAITVRPAEYTPVSAPTIRWSAVAGYAVSYDVSVDGVVTTTSGTEITTSALSDGIHTVKVTAKSARNWWHPVNSATTFSFTVDTVAPTVATVSATQYTATWTTTATDVSAVEVRVDAGATTTLSVAARSHNLMVYALPAGEHTFEVRLVDRAGNIGAWKPAGFAVLPNAAPVAEFSASNSSGQAPLAVSFDGSGSHDDDGLIDSWAWSFGDGASASGVIAAHAYVSAGDYTVQLTVTDDRGATAQRSEIIHVTAPPPPPAAPMPVYRFYNLTNSSHFYTASADERDVVKARWPDVYDFEGSCYSVNATNPANDTPLYRFYNLANGTHFYTASSSERDDVLARLWRTYQYEGPVYNVSVTANDSMPMYRFYNLRNGSHFYTVSAAEKQMVAEQLSGTYSFEGAAYYIGY